MTGWELGQIDKIDPLYYKYSSERIDVKEETKISATKQESDAYYTVSPSESRTSSITPHLVLDWSAEERLKS